MVARDVVTYPDSAVLTADELVAYLRIEKDHVYELLSKGEIPSVKLGRQYRIPMWGVIQWLARRSGAPYSQGAGSSANTPGLRH